MAGSTPRETSHWVNSVWRSYTLSAIFRPFSVREIKPSSHMVMQSCSRRFLMATLTLGLENPISAAMSTERTVPLRSFSTRIVSR